MATCSIEGCGGPVIARGWCRITEKRYAELLAEQDGKCAVCGTTEPANRGRKHFCVDHDHATGAMRGLLCQPCNVGLGGFKDDPALLRAAINYLGRDSAP